LGRLGIVIGPKAVSTVTGKPVSAVVDGGGAVVLAGPAVVVGSAGVAQAANTMVISNKLTSFLINILRFGG
jgi:hypothetical protein